MEKHAFLIIAHKDDENFRALIKLLDHPGNDIFIHMDRKNKAYNSNSVKEYVKYSGLVHVRRFSVTWGGFSMVKAELELLKKATQKNNYKFYHLLSGDDLPIKKIDEIHSFFDMHPYCQFVGMVNETQKYRFRVNRYYFFQNRIGRDKTKSAKCWSKLDRYIELVSRKTKYERNKSLKLWYGSQWFSITDEFARYVVKNRNWIWCHFNYTFIPDELFLQTLLARSPFFNQAFKIEQNSSYKSALRYIDWGRGRPYVFKEEDFFELVNSDMIFARKFDSSQNPEITRKILAYLKEN